MSRIALKTQRPTRGTDSIKRNSCHNFSRAEAVDWGEKAASKPNLKIQHDA